MSSERGIRIHNLLLAGALALTTASAAMSDIGSKPDPKLDKHLDRCVFGKTFHDIERKLPIRRIVK